MSAPAVELRDVRKNFGRTEIIRGVSLSIATPWGSTLAWYWPVKTPASCFVHRSRTMARVPGKRPIASLTRNP